MDIVTGSISGDVHLFRRKPNGSYLAGETLRKGFRKPINVGRGSSVAVADWDGDGDVDLVIGNADGAVYLVANQGTLQKPAWGEPERLRAAGQPITGEGGNAAPCVADWDGDGNPDLLLGSATGSVVWFKNAGTKPKPKLAAAAVLVEAAPKQEGNKPSPFEDPKRSAYDAKVCVVDWNGDGLRDLVVGDYAYIRKGNSGKTHGYVWVYLRTREGAKELGKN
jgi:hypothetical protein